MVSKLRVTCSCYKGGVTRLCQQSHLGFLPVLAFTLAHFKDEINGFQRFLNFKACVMCVKCANKNRYGNDLNEAVKVRSLS